MKSTWFCVFLAFAGFSATYGWSIETLNFADEVSQYAISEVADRLSEEIRSKRDASKLDSSKTQTISSGAKNQTNSNGDGSDDGTYCVGHTVQDFQRELKANGSKFGNLTDPYVGYEGHQFYSRINEDALKSLCSLYIPRRSQLDRCPNSTYKVFATDAFGIFDFVCLQRYDDLNKQMPCLRKADPDISSTCTPKCSDAQDKIEGFSNIDNSTKRAHSIVYANGTSNITAASLTAFSRFCKHVKCLIQCQTPVVKKQCGLPAVQLIHDGVHLLFTKLNRLNAASSLQEYWPKDCSDLSTLDFNDTSKSGKS